MPNLNVLDATGLPREHGEEDMQGLGTQSCVIRTISGDAEL